MKWEWFFDRYDNPTLLTQSLLTICLLLGVGVAVFYGFIDKDDQVGLVVDKYWVREVRIEIYTGTEVEVKPNQIPDGSVDCTCYTKSFSMVEEDGLMKPVFDNYCKCGVYRWQLSRVLRAIDSGREYWPEYELGEWERVRSQSINYFYEIKYKDKTAKCQLETKEEWEKIKVEQEVVSRGNWLDWDACEVN